MSWCTPFLQFLSHPRLIHLIDHLFYQFHQAMIMICFLALRKKTQKKQPLVIETESKIKMAASFHSEALLITAFIKISDITGDGGCCSATSSCCSIVDAELVGQSKSLCLCPYKMFLSHEAGLRRLAQGCLSSWNEMLSFQSVYTSSTT